MTWAFDATSNQYNQRKSYHLRYREDRHIEYVIREGKDKKLSLHGISALIYYWYQ